MQRRQDPEHMKALLARRERHSWSWAELSRRSGLPVWKLHWWQRRLAKERLPGRPERAFVRVEVVDSLHEDPQRLEVITRSGLRVVVPAQFSAEHLRRVLEALEAGC